MTNKEKNAALKAAIQSQLKELGLEEIKHYVFTFNDWRKYPDYNLAEYGNLLVYFDDIRDLYRKCGYRWAEYASDMKLWESYKRIVGYTASQMIANNK